MDNEKIFSNESTDAMDKDALLKKQNENLVYMTFLQREEERYHHSYDEELLQYEYIQNGDMRGIKVGKNLLQSRVIGKLSDDPLRNIKYLFVSSTTLTTRFCIEGGMDSQTAYNLSDLYIQQMDKCNSIAAVDQLLTLMITDFTEKMAVIHTNSARSGPSSSSGRHSSLSKPIIKVLDYIYYHLHQKISLQELSEVANLTPNYLATLFKQEMGLSIHSYIRSKKIEAAQNMLLHSEYTLTEIGEFLAFSSSSHFIKVFKEATGMTPKEYQRTNYRKHQRWAKMRL